MEKFHEKVETPITEPILNECSGELSQRNSMLGCLRNLDFNPEPQNKKYILGRCLLNHTTQNNTFKDNIVEGCPRHETLCQSSGCSDSVNYFWKNLRTLKSITDESLIENNQENNIYGGLLKKCPCNYEIDKTSQQYPKYQEWVEKVKQIN